MILWPSVENFRIPKATMHFMQTSEICWMMYWDLYVCTLQHAATFMSFTCSSLALLQKALCSYNYVKCSQSVYLKLCASVHQLYKSVPGLSWTIWEMTHCASSFPVAVDKNCICHNLAFLSCLYTFVQVPNIDSVQLYVCRSHPNSTILNICLLCSMQNFFKKLMVLSNWPGCSVLEGHKFSQLSWIGLVRDSNFPCDCFHSNRMRAFKEVWLCWEMSWRQRIRSHSTGSSQHSGTVRSLCSRSKNKRRGQWWGQGRNMHGQHEVREEWGLGHVGEKQDAEIRWSTDT